MNKAISLEAFRGRRFRYQRDNRRLYTSASLVKMEKRILILDRRHFDEWLDTNCSGYWSFGDFIIFFASEDDALLFYLTFS